MQFPHLTESKKANEKQKLVCEDLSPHEGVPLRDKIYLIFSRILD